MKISKKNIGFLIIFIIFFTVFIGLFVVKTSILTLYTSRVDYITVNSVSDGVPIHAEIYTPKNIGTSAPLIIINHGYTGSLLQSRNLCSLLNKFGFVACAIDTRGHGLSGSVLPTEVSEWRILGHDIMSVIFYIVDNAVSFKINKSLIGIVGGSMGGYSSTAAGLLYPSTYNQTLTGTSFNISAVINLAFSGTYLDQFEISNETSPPNYLMVVGDSDILFNLPETFASFRKVANTTDTNEAIIQKNYYGNFTNYNARKLIIVPNAGHEVIENYAAAQLVYNTMYAWFKTSFQLNSTAFENISLPQTYLDEFELSRNIGSVLGYIAMIAAFAALFIILPWIVKKFKKESYVPERIEFLNQKNRSILGLGVTGILFSMVVLGTLLSPFFTFLQVLGSNFLMPFFILSIICLSGIIILLIRNIFPRQNEEFPRDFLEKTNLKLGIVAGFVSVGVYWTIQLVMNSIDGVLFIGGINKIFVFITYIVLIVPFFFIFNIFAEELIQRQFKQRELGIIFTILTGLALVMPGFLIYTLITYINRIYIGNGVFAYGDTAQFFGYALFFGPIIYYLTRNSFASSIFSGVYLAFWLTSLPMNVISF